MSPAFDCSPECIHLLVYQLLNLWVLHRRLPACRGMRECYMLNELLTRVTSRTTVVCGFTVPRSRWNRMECNSARSTSLVVWRSRTWWTSVLAVCIWQSPPYDVNDNHWWLCTVHCQTRPCMRYQWAPIDPSSVSPFPTLRRNGFQSRTSYFIDI